MQPRSHTTLALKLNTKTGLNPSSATETLKHSRLVASVSALKVAGAPWFGFTWQAGVLILR